MGNEFRTEHDLLGERRIPMDAYYGIHTQRAIDNFRITKTRIGHYPDLVNALAMVKMSAARANADLGMLDDEKFGAIEAACKEILMGWGHEHFVVDVIQGGAGTSTNMNANEVIANRALELLGREKGDYGYIHPLEDVNMSQSTNDAYPTALRVASYFSLERLADAMEELLLAFRAKAEDFDDVIKMGRTQLQDAVPMRLGQEFSSFGTMVAEDIVRLGEARALMLEVNLGGTAIGTGINTDVDYRGLAIAALCDVTGVEFSLPSDLVAATQNVGAFIHLSSVLKRIAIKLSKISNDLRLLSSGPGTGFGDINLPAVQAGSSIMPGKVNPVIPEVVNQIAFEVIGNDLAVTMAAEGGQLQLNAFEPIIFHSILKSSDHLQAGCTTLARRCVIGITANRDRLYSNVTRSVGLVTALSPEIGYEAATDVAKEALATGKSVLEVVLERGLLSKEELSAILNPENLTEPGHLADG